MTTILTTTGISLYTYSKKQNNTMTPTKEQMRHNLRISAKVASAEANSLLQISNSTDHLVLLHTQTPEAIQCAELLRDYFSNEGYKYVKTVRLDFQSDPRHIETTGLRNLITTLIDQIQEAKRHEQDVVINATAGLKAQVVYSTMIGMIYQVPVKYLYEDFKTIVTFNPIAVDWDTSLFSVHDSFFKWFEAQSRTQKEIENYLKDYPEHERERIKAVFTSPDVNGEVVLSDMGQALRRKSLDEQREVEEAEFVELPPPSQIENIQDKLTSSILNANHHPSKGALEVCLKIAAIDYVKKVISDYYENTVRTAIKVRSDGSIILLWAGGTRSDRFIISTTADLTTDRGKAQNRKAAQKIKELLEIP